MTRHARGVFGGTFDPPHVGHVAAVHAALDSLGLGELVVTVARDPQLKDEPPCAPAEVRLELARAAFGAIDRVVVSDVELRRDGPTYTIDTVEEMVAASPDVELVLVVGADAAASLPRWHRAGDLARLVTLGIVPRPGGEAVEPEGFSARWVQMAPVDLSSTAVRAALRAGHDPHGLVPDAVVHMLLANRLYSP